MSPPITPSESDPIAAVTRTSQIIIGALISGLMIFLGVVLVLRSGSGKALPPGGSGTPILTYVAIAFAVGVVPLSMILPDWLIAEKRRRLGRDLRTGPTSSKGNRAIALTPLFPSWLIVGAALRQFVGFFSLIAYMIEGSPVALFLAMLLILGVAMRFPTRVGVERWLEDQLRRLDEGS